MLKLVEENDEKRFSEFCRPFALGIRMRCLLSAYGTASSLVRFWLGENNGKITCAVCLFGGSATVIMRDDALVSELSAFLNAFDFTDLCAQGDTLEKLGFKPDYSKRMFWYTDPLLADYEKAQTGYEDLSEVYALIARAIPGSFSAEREAYLSWLSDFTFRSRRRLARLKTIANDETLLSCALTAAECSDGAIISGVACDEKARGQHLGQRTVRTIADELSGEGKTVYVIALNEEASSFYLKTGFSFCDTVSYIERKN
ncbi:MAG: GNAT family N-acetyltransferase [Acutalibacteraceae bacterium]